MMMEIIKIVVVLIGAAMLHDYLKHASRSDWVLAARGMVIGAVVALLLSLTRDQEWRSAMMSG